MGARKKTAAVAPPVVAPPKETPDEARQKLYTRCWREVDDTSTRLGIAPPGFAVPDRSAASTSMADILSSVLGAGEEDLMEGLLCTVQETASVLWTVSYTGEPLKHETESFLLRIEKLARAAMAVYRKLHGSYVDEIVRLRMQVAELEALRSKGAA